MAETIQSLLDAATIGQSTLSSLINGAIAQRAGVGKLPPSPLQRFEREKLEAFGAHIELLKMKASIIITLV